MRDHRRGNGPALILLMAAFLGTALLGAGTALAAQEPARTAGLRCRVMVEFLGPSGPASQLFADSLDSTLIQSSSVLSIARTVPGEDSLALRAERDACSVALQVSLELGAESSSLGWKVYLPPREEPVAQGRVEKELPGARGLATTFWQEPLSALEAAIAEAEIPSSYVTIVGAPGTKIHGIGPEIVLPESGEVDVPLVIPAYLVWSAEADGARPESGNARVEESGKRLEIPRHPLRADSRWSMDFSLLGFSFPELSARYDVRDRFFLRATCTQYFAGLYLRNSSDTGGDSSIISSYGLLQPGMGFGYLFSRRSAPFRFYSSLDLFLRLAFIEDEGVRLEPVAPWGSCLALGADWGRDASLRLFLEMGIVVYPWADRTLMLASWNGKGMGRATIGGGGFIKGQPGWLAEFPQPRVGLRIRL